MFYHIQSVSLILLHEVSRWYILKNIYKEYIEESHKQISIFDREFTLNRTSTFT